MNEIYNKKIFLISVFAVAIFAIFTVATTIGTKSILDMSSKWELENKFQQVLGTEISNKNIEKETNLANQFENIKTVDLYSIDFQYRVIDGKNRGKLGASDNYSFYLSWPVINGLGYVTQCFYNEGDENDHNGVDIAYYSYPKILAAAPGKVIFAGCYSEECPVEGEKKGGTGLARTIIIEHDYGFITVYGHLDEIYVEEGEEVLRGQVIGKMGQSGTIEGDSGVHLHFSLLKDLSWTLLDPSDYLMREICVDGIPDEAAFY